jgi:hypothetical protein
MIFFPVSYAINDSCQGVDQYRLSRPIASESFVSFSVFLCTFSPLLWTAGLVWFYFNRRHPRLNAIRPFVLSVIVVVGQICWSIININLTHTYLPCALVPFSLLIGMGGVAVTFYLRLVVFTVESQFAKCAHLLRIKDRQTQQQQDTDTVRASSKPVTDGDNASYSSFNSPSHWLAMLDLFQLLIGSKSLDKLSIENVAHAKQSYVTISLITVLPGLVPFAGVLIAFPAYAQCSRCAVFYEVLVSFFIQGMCYFLLGLRVTWVLYRANFPDKSGVFFELVCCLITGGCILLTTVVWMFDPNQAEFNFVFAYEWIYQLLMIVYWWF